MTLTPTQKEQVLQLLQKDRVTEALDLARALTPPPGLELIMLSARYNRAQQELATNHRKLPLLDEMLRVKNSLCASLEIDHRFTAGDVPTEKVPPTTADQLTEIARRVSWLLARLPDKPTENLALRILRLRQASTAGTLYPGDFAAKVNQLNAAVAALGNPPTAADQLPAADYEKFTRVEQLRKAALADLTAQENATGQRAILLQAKRKHLEQDKMVGSTTISEYLLQSSRLDAEEAKLLDGDLSGAGPAPFYIDKGSRMKWEGGKK
ncbi:MAG: hypothetical protein AAFZ52_08490 [Bacteroidota bacterium]